jgi:hypothetical protein
LPSGRKLHTKNSNPASEQKFIQKKIGGPPAATFGQKQPKIGQKKYLMKNVALHLKSEI